MKRESINVFSLLETFCCVVILVFLFKFLGEDLAPHLTIFSPINEYIFAISNGLKYSLFFSLLSVIAMRIALFYVKENKILIILDLSLKLSFLYVCSEYGQKRISELSSIKYTILGGSEIVMLFFILLLLCTGILIYIFIEKMNVKPVRINNKAKINIKPKFQVLLINIIYFSMICFSALYIVNNYELLSMKLVLVCFLVILSFFMGKQVSFLSTNIRIS